MDQLTTFYRSWIQPFLTTFGIAGALQFFVAAPAISMLSGPLGQIGIGGFTPAVVTGLIAVVSYTAAAKIGL